MNAELPGSPLTPRLSEAQRYGDAYSARPVLLAGQESLSVRAMEDRFTIAPARDVRMAGLSRRTVLKHPVRLTATTRAHSSGAISQTAWARPSCFGEMPALFTRMSKEPPSVSCSRPQAASKAG